MTGVAEHELTCPKLSVHLVSTLAENHAEAITNESYEELMQHIRCQLLMKKFFRAVEL